MDLMGKGKGKKMNKTMNKKDLQDLAFAKVRKMKISELKKFIGIGQPLVVVPEVFRIDGSFSINSWNNTSSGRSSGGGNIYKRAVVRIINQEINNRELEISVKWFVPSGFEDGNIDTEPVQYILTDVDLVGIKEYGTRDFLKAIFQIPYALQYDTQPPYTLPKKK